MAGNKEPPDNASKTTPSFLDLLCEPPTIVVVEVGPERKRYHLQKALLTPHSEYFRKAFEGPWKEAEEKLVTLEDVDVSAWNLLVSWFYTQRLPGQPRKRTKVPASVDFDDLKSEWAEATGHPSASWLEVCMAMLKASVLSDRLLMPAFGCTIRKMMVTTLDALNFEETKNDRVLPARLFKYTSENFPANHPLLQYFVALWFKYETENSMPIFGRGPVRKPSLSSIKNLPHNFSQRLAWWSSQRTYAESPCFLEHASNQEEYDCQKTVHLIYVPEFKTSIPYESEIKKKYDNGRTG